MTKKLAMLICDGFEEIEAITVIDVLRRAGLRIDLIALEKLELIGSHNIELKADYLLDVVEADDYDGLVLPGGLPGAHTLRDDARAQGFIKAFEGRLQSAICAAPIALASTGVLEGRRVTSHPSKESDFPGSEYVCEAVVRDGEVVTSRGAGTAFDFAVELLKYFNLDEKAESLRIAMMYS
jgi:protein deglycase